VQEHCYGLKWTSLPATLAVNSNNNTEIVESKESVHTDLEVKFTNENTENNKLNNSIKNDRSLNTKSDDKEKTEPVTLDQQSEKVPKNIDSKAAIESPTNSTNQLFISELSQSGTDYLTVEIVNQNSMKDRDQDTEPIHTLVNKYFVFQRSTIDHFPTSISMAFDSNFNEKDSKDEIKSSNLRVDIYGGINFSNHNYSSTNTAIDLFKNISENAYARNTFSVFLSKPIYKSINASVGLEYNDLWTKTEINLSELWTTTLSNELWKIEVNSQTQDTIFFTKDRTVNALYTRELVHYNNIKTISFPLSIGYHLNMKRFDLGINIGILYSMRTHQSGKGYNNQGEIFEYENNSSTLPF
jgi:hypothetical protein